MRRMLVWEYPPSSYWLFPPATRRSRVTPKTCRLQLYRRNRVYRMCRMLVWESPPSSSRLHSPATHLSRVTEKNCPLQLYRRNRVSRMCRKSVWVYPPSSRRLPPAAHLFRVTPKTCRLQLYRRELRITHVPKVSLGVPAFFFAAAFAGNESISGYSEDVSVTFI